MAKTTVGVSLGCVLLLVTCLSASAQFSGTCGQSEGYEPRTRDVWIVIEESEWNYVPDDRNLIKDTSLENDVFVEVADNRVGSTYVKARYVEYTADFGEVVEKPQNLQYTGNLGPVIRAVVGDTVNVHVRNDGTKQYSVHGHGVKFEKQHEGFFHNDGEGEFPGDQLDPGEEHTYVWEIAERSGPARNDFSSILWAYHSHVSVTADINSGLVGPIVVVNPAYITSEDQAASATPCDIDNEVFLYLTVSDENLNKLLDTNLERMPGFDALSEAEVEELVEDEDFVESNLMHGMNGYLYGNMPEITMTVGERVRWYMFSFGTEVDLHSLAWHGHTVETSLGKRTATIFLSASIFEVADMYPDVPGKWIVECHTHDHLDAGMQHFYTVLPSE